MTQPASKPTYGRPASRRLNWITVLVFCLFISAPLVTMVLGLSGDLTALENRRLAPFPAETVLRGQWARFPTEFEDYFNDHFGLRGTFIRLYMAHRKAFLDESPIEQVILGRDGWLFFASQEGGDPVACYQGTNLFSQEALKKVAASLISWRDWLATRNIPFILILPPNKHAIYSEMLPDSIKKAAGETRLDQVVKYLAENTNLTVVDVRPDLLKAKGRLPLYYRTDTHWNYLGGFYAYRRLMDDAVKVAPGARIRELDDFDVKVGEKKGGDLARMMLQPDSIPDLEIVLEPRDDERPADRPVIVLYSDSYGVYIEPYLKLSFGRVVFQPGWQMDPEVIEREHPDLVVLSVVERLIGDLVDLKTPEQTTRDR